MFTAARLAEFQSFESANPMTAAAPIGRRVLHRAIRFATSIAIAEAKRKDPNFNEAEARAEIDRAVQEIGDGRIWEWLINGGFEKILEWVKLIIGMFG